MKKNIKWIVAGATIAVVVLFSLISMARHRAAAQPVGSPFTERQILDHTRSLCRLLLPDSGDLKMKATYSAAEMNRPSQKDALKLWDVACTTADNSAHAIVIFDGRTGVVRLISVYSSSSYSTPKDLPMLTPAERLQLARQWVGDCDDHEDGDQWRLTSSRTFEHDNYEFAWQKDDQCARVVINGYTGQLVHFYTGPHTMSHGQDEIIYHPALAGFQRP